MNSDETRSGQILSLLCGAGVPFIVSLGLCLCLAPARLSANEVYHVNDPVVTVAVQPDQKILIATWGSDLFCFDQVSGGFAAFMGGVLRFNSDGSLDRSFQCSMCAMACLSLRRDGHILVHGSFIERYPARRANLAILLPDGRFDESFVPYRGLNQGIPPWWPYASLYTAALESNGCVIMPPIRIPRICDAAFARFDHTGRLLPLPAREFPQSLAFGMLTVKNDRNPSDVAREAFETVPLELCRNALRLPDSGAVLLVRASDGCHLWRFDSEWQRVVNFNSRVEFEGSNETFNARVCLASDSDGRLLVGGAFSRLNGEEFRGLARLHPDGSTDRGFNAVTDAEVSSIATQADGHIVIGGFFKRVNLAECAHFGRLNPDGTLDRKFQSRFVTADRMKDLRRVPLVRLSATSPRNALASATDSPTGPVTGPASEPTQTILITSLSIDQAGTTVIQFTGQPRFAYILQARNRVGESAWTSLTTNVTDVTGHGAFLDSDGATFRMRFYRIASP